VKLFFMQFPSSCSYSCSLRSKYPHYRAYGRYFVAFVLAYFPKIGLCCRYVCVSSQSTFDCLHKPLWNMACISRQVSPSRRRSSETPPSSLSICLSLLSLQDNGSVNCISRFGTRQRPGKHVPAATNTRNNRRIVGRVIFYAVRVLSNGSLWVCLCILLSLYCKNSVKTFTRQRRISGGVFSYAVRKFGD
jgi:hypothetical protein